MLRTVICFILFQSTFGNNDTFSGNNTRDSPQLIVNTSIEKVKLNVFTRAFCPACVWFLSDVLPKIAADEELMRMLDLRVYPVAGMTMDEENKMECEGGEMECQGHRWFACVMKQHANNASLYLKDIACLEKEESGPNWTSRLETCVDRDMYQSLAKCFQKDSVELVKHLVQVEHDAGVEWMPYIKVNDKVLGEFDTGVDFDYVVAAICKKYEGPVEMYPSTCPKMTEDSGKVRLEIYWRGYCPACAWFLSTPLPQLLRIPGFLNIVNFIPVPAAGTKYLDNGVFKCSGGPTECDGHKWLSCAIEKFPTKKHIEIISCLEGTKEAPKKDWNKKVQVCTNEAERKIMHDCFQQEGAKLLKQHALTVADRGGVGWMPYILVDGKVLGDAKHGVPYDALVESICKAYHGEAVNLPTECNANVESMESEEEKESAQVIKPCPNKKKPEAKQYKDPPGIGSIERRTLFSNKRNIISKTTTTENVESNMMKMVLVLCFLCVAFIYYQFFHRQRATKKFH